MPEYLAPGVYVEEVSYRSKSIEGVPTSTTAFAGRTRTGPVHFFHGPTTSEPRLITSFTEYESVYGGLEPFEDGSINYMAHAARMFFENGGQRLYVSRVFAPKAAGDFGVASVDVAAGDAALGAAAWHARWPGAYGKVSVSASLVLSGSVWDSTRQVLNANEGAVVGLVTPPAAPPPGQPPPAKRATEPPPHAYAIARFDAKSGAMRLFDAQGLLGGTGLPAGGDLAKLVSFAVTVQIDGEHEQVSSLVSPGFDQTRYIGKILGRDNPEDENSVVWLDLPNKNDAATLALVGKLVDAQGKPKVYALTGGNDGGALTAADVEGLPADPDRAEVKATGLAALAEIDDIAIVATPDAGGYDDADTVFSIAEALIGHAETCRYRIAIVDGPKGASMNGIRAFRGKLDTKYGALYHPWIEIENPLERPSQGAPPSKLLLPPSGAVAGIYARSDIERGVHKAPANEVVRSLTRFEQNINKPRQDVLNPEGINALRFFEGRGNRVWGARTLSSDPEWKYVNVRRLFIYLEHSLDKGTQYAVFEPNNERLWANVKQSVEDFLFVQWKNGALLGAKPEEAYFVRCDRTTMSQNDLDNGRLVCLVGVAPVMPAEYVVFRIGQFTASSKN